MIQRARAFFVMGAFACFNAFLSLSPVTAQESDAAALSKAESPMYRGLDANLYMQTSAEYRAACHQAYNWATLRLRQAVSLPSANDRPIAVVMDLDETVLDNGGFQSWMLRTGRAYQQHWFDRWEQTGGEHVGLVPGAKEFIESAQAMGVTVVHISNRNDRFREFTKATLARLGIPITDDRELKLSSTTSDKTARRREVEEGDRFRIVLYVGDNLRDFDNRFKMPALDDDATDDQIAAAIEFRKKLVDRTNAYWGNRWIVLPNPAYGEWNKALGRGTQDLQRLSRSGRHIGVAFWNVENLFDTIDDPSVKGDEEFSPDGPNKWTDERLNVKLENLARVIGRMNDGLGPDVMGLAEIENREVVEMLVARLAMLGRDYKVVHRDSPSGRGIDCALFYDANVFALSDAQFHHVDAENTRDIVEATLTRDGASVTLFVNHWPARSHDESFRVAAGETLRGRIDELLKKNALADIVVMGDLNDHPNDASVVSALGAVGDLDEVANGKLFNTSYTEDADATSGTYVYRNQWETIDQVLISPGLLIPGGVSWGVGSTHTVVLADDQMYKPSGNGIPVPSRTYTGRSYHANGYSDHMPVVTSLFWMTPSER